MTSDRWASAAEGEGIVFDGLFSNWRDAVVFGLNYSSAQYGEAALAKAVKRGGSGKGLFGVDGAAQAGMILAAIERLGDTEASAIVARFAVRTEPCPCCGGDKAVAKWVAAVEHLAAVCIPAGVSNVRCRRDMVGKHFGLKAELSALASRYNMCRNTLGKQYQIIERMLSDIEASAQKNIDMHFTHGL